MTDKLCTYSGRREDAIVDYLYGEVDSNQCLIFETHLSRCAVCRAEVEALGGVRDQLEQWAPPEPMLALDHPAGPVASTRLPSGRQGWREVPVWAQAAAAILCIGVGAGAANVQVTYGRDGLSVRTGWRQPAPTGPGASSPAIPAIDASRGVDAPTAVPSRAELSTLEETLRAEIRAAVATRASAPSEPAAATAAASDAVLRQVRTLIANSERRQQLELALRVGDVINDVQAQRRADLLKIDRSIGLIQNSTGMEVLRQREMLNSLAVRVSSQR
jgi:hypothetical protein